jgi:glycosyltransferase involved in cell wall biosynthesis
MNSSRRKRVLLVTSAYMPATNADVHRARYLAWELPRLGWDVEILTPDASFQRKEFLDADAAPLFNPEIVVHEVAPRNEWIFRLFKMRSVGWRARANLARAGDRLLAGHDFDLVYFTTTNFPLFGLGRRWKRRFGVPYVLDYHDPWIRKNVQHQTTTHTFKLKVTDALATGMERRAVQSAAGIIAVSPLYIHELRDRYGNLSCLQPDRCQAIPFAAREQDAQISPPRLSGQAGIHRLVYIGAGGSIMAKSFTTICMTLADIRRTEPELTADLRIEIFGTYPYWKAGDPTPLHEIAARFGLGDLVTESPARVSYRTALELTSGSDGLLVLGVDDEGYVPSKLFSYAVSGKPLLASLREHSAAGRLFEQMPGLGNLLTFANDDAKVTDTALASMRTFLSEVRRGVRIDRRMLVAEYLAPSMAQRHATIFERICERSKTS